MPVVASRLYGEPERKRGDEWRYHAKGSLVVHVGGERNGTWRCFETGASGGVLALVEHELGCDRAGALDWLGEQGIIPPRAGGARGGQDPRLARVLRRPPARTTARPDDRKQQQRAKTAHLVPALLAASVAADDTPARAYLAGRRTWPPLGIGPALPDSVRWVARERVPVSLPPAAAGAVLFAYAPPGGEPDGVKLEALTAAGERLQERWRRQFGQLAGRVFTAASVPGGELWLTEGECDALALALTGHGGEVRATGGTSGWQMPAVTDPERRRVVLLPDADAAGGRAALKLRYALLDAGRACTRLHLPAGDVADVLAAWLDRLSKSHGGDEAAAWGAVLAQVRDGARLFEPGAADATAARPPAAAAAPEPEPLQEPEPAPLAEARAAPEAGARPLFDYDGKGRPLDLQGRPLDAESVARVEADGGWY